MVSTGNIYVLVTVGLLLCSTSYTGVSSACTSKSATADLFPVVFAGGCSKGCFRASTFTCKPCPPPCVTCKNSTYCTECIDERWGPACDRNCLNCVKRKCSIRNGSCLYGCENGFYALMKSGPCVMCPPNCGNCSSSRCLNCNPGFYGTYCKQKCPPNCQICSSIECSRCKPGFTGKLCEIECALCKKGLCSLEGCIEGCIDGYFSSNNTKSCQKCPHDCISCTSLKNCTSCVSGYHGRSCEHKCNFFCHNATCDKTTGECNHGCKDHYYKDKIQCLRCPHCASCHTAECQTSCCEVTTQPACEVINCKTCGANNTRFCDECLKGYYITNNGSCEQCSPKCRNKTCYHHDGTCISGCIDGWKGPRCTEDRCGEKGYYRDQDECLSCPRCSSCRTAACVSSCCEVTTPSICGVKSCNRCKANDPRFCVECSNGSYVTDMGTCKPCSQYCKDRSCDPYNGTCLFGCVHGWKGPSCEESACINNSCGANTTNRRRSGNLDESGENSIVIGAGIGSTIFVLVVVVITTVVLVRRNKRVQQKSTSPMETETDATDANTYYNIMSSSNERSVLETTNQNTEMQSLPESSEYVNVDNISNTINTYEALGKRDEHIYAKNTYDALGSRRDEDHLYSKSAYEALGARDEDYLYSKSTYEALAAREEDHLYSKSNYEALGARDEHTYGTAEEPTYVNNT